MSRSSSESTKASTADRSDTSSFTGPRRETAWHVTPSAVSRCTIAAPIPLPPPVTTATLPARDSSTQEDLDVVGGPSGQLGEGGRTAIQGQYVFQLTNSGSALSEQVERTREVGVLVAEDSADGVVAAHDSPPWEGSLVAVHADEHRGAARAEQVEGDPARRLGAGRVDHELDTGLHALGSLARIASAQPQRVLAARRMALDDGHVGDAVEQRRLHAGQADRPGADDDSALDALRGALADGVHAVGERFDERAQARVHARRHDEEATLRHHDAVGKAAGHRDADEVAIGAQVAPAVPAVPAAAAAD